MKGRKKKARRRSYSRDSSEDSLYARKRKKAKRKSEYKAREKPYKKKSIRREATVSSASSGSWSCSTCQGGSASRDDSQYESHRGRSERKEKDKRRLERGRSGSKKSSRYRARSCSSCSHSSESNYERTEDNYVGENNSRRLRSVITVAKEAEESREFSRNETKEEIVDDHDYPCRSNDSNDGGTKRELDHPTLPATEEKLGDEDVIGDVNADSAGTTESMKKKTSETSGDNLNGDDLESILRQKALENLRKFRGGTQSTAKASDQENKIVSQVKQPINDNHNVAQGKSNVNNAAVGTKFDNQTFVEESTNCRTNKPELTTPESCHDSLRNRLSLKQKPVSGLSQEKLVAAESSKDRDISEASHIASHRSNDNVDNISKPSSHRPKFGHNNLNKGQDEVKDNSWFELKQTSASHEPPDLKLPATEGAVERNEAKTTQAAIQSTNNSGKDADELRNSTTTKFCIENSTVEDNAGKLQDESNQGSQFEQKTMNVMRGGEMVQVSI